MSYGYYGYGGPSSSDMWLAYAGYILMGAAFLYWLVTLIAFLFTPVEEKRLDLEGEAELDSLRTWSLRAKQTAVLTNMKLYQSGVFRYGKSRRSNIIPLDSIDSVQIASGRNYLWLAVAISTFLNMVFVSRGGGANVALLLLTLLFFGVFWISGSRQITVRSKTTSITVEASIMNMDILSSLSAGGAGPVSDSRVFAFANRIQSLIIKPRANSAPAGAVAPTPPLPHAIPPVAVASAPAPATVAPVPAPAAAAPALAATPGMAHCQACRAVMAVGSRFCEECGQPVSA